MSQKSTARTGSDGDVEFKEARNNNARSGSSSCKSKRDIFGGPFGDSPFDQAQDYLLIMFRNNDETPATSEGSQADLDLYNLRNNYTEQLNLVRKKLNLMELTEEEPQRCTITEVDEDAPGSSKKDERVQTDRSYATQTVSREVSNETVQSKGYELTTIHPFSVNYNLQSGSSTNIFEPDYSPPKKKVCQRMKTPRFISLSEASVPYHTKIGIHESLFRNEGFIQGRDKKLFKGTVNRFTETRETQCNEEEIKKENLPKFTDRASSVPQSARSIDDRFSILNLSFDSESETEDDTSVSGTLFPKVIIETKRDLDEAGSSASSQPFKRYTTTSSSNRHSVRKDSDKNILSLNSVRESSDDESQSVTRTNTIIDTTEMDNKKKTSRKTSSKASRVPSTDKITMWEEINRLQSETEEGKTDGAGDADASYDMHEIHTYMNELSQTINLGDIMKKESEKTTQAGSMSKLNQYIRQYVNYKKEVEKVRTAPTKKRNKYTIIGQRLVNMQNRILESPDKLYQSESSLVSDEDRCEILASSQANPNETEVGRSFWERLCCLCPDRNFND